MQNSMFSEGVTKPVQGQIEVITNLHQIPSQQTLIQECQDTIEGAKSPVSDSH